MIPIISETTHIFSDRESPKEVSISLFGECNMKCDFCIGCNRHAIRFNADVLNKTLDAITTTLDASKRRVFNFMIYGGELFHDGISDEVFKLYKNFLLSIKDETEKRGKTPNILLATNLIHTKRDRVIALLSECGIHRLNTSYDSVGRFKGKHQLNTFLENLNFYTEKGISIQVGLTLTHENLEFLSNSTDIILNDLYERFPISLDYFHPIKGMNNPVEEQRLGEFFVKFYRKYPKIITFQELKDNFRGEGSLCSCPAAFITDGVLLPDCCDFKKDLMTYVKNKGCFGCKYAKMCPHKCVNLMRNFKDCHLKIFFEELPNE